MNTEDIQQEESLLHLFMEQLPPHQQLYVQQQLLRHPELRQAVADNIRLKQQATDADAQKIIEDENTQLQELIGRYAE